MLLIAQGIHQISDIPFASATPGKCACPSRNPFQLHALRAKLDDHAMRGAAAWAKHDILFFGGAGVHRAADRLSGVGNVTVSG